MGNVWLVRRCT